jgi:aspartate aminotransferase
MGHDLDRVPFSGIIRIRDLMYGVDKPFRLDQGDVSFDAPASVKEAMARAIAENRTHYAQTTGLPRLRELIADKLRRKNDLPIGTEDEVLITNGGIHAIYVACQALLDSGDEVVVPDPEWPPCVGNVLAARAIPVAWPLSESRGWRYDLDKLRASITPRTRAIYLNSPHNPTGSVLERRELEVVAAVARDHGLWVISDESYEDVLFDGASHTSIASLPGMYERTVPIYTFSKSYAMTGLRLGYLAIKDPLLRERARKVLFHTTTHVSTVVQYGGIGGLEGPQDCIEAFRRELEARRDLFYAAIGEIGADVFSGTAPRGAFYGFLRIGPVLERLAREATAQSSSSWSATEFLIARGRIGCVPGVDFGATGEGYVRFCFARERAELTGAIDALRSIVGLPAGVRALGRD